MSDIELVQRKWPSAHVLRGGPSYAKSAYCAVFVGAATLKGGNGLRRKSGWFETEAEAWADAANRIGRELMAE
jgi:hypothetical protein